MNREKLEHAVVTAALRLPPARCSTRGIAADLGVSQSTVSRFWRGHLRDSPAAARLAELARADRLVLAGVLITRQGSQLLLRRLPSGGTQGLGTASQAFVGRWRAVLGADAMRPWIGQRAGSVEQEAVRVDRFRSALDAVGADAVVVTDLPSGQVRAPEGATVLGVEPGGEWSGLVTVLSTLPEHLADSAVADVVARLQHWYRNVDGTFAWAETGPGLDSGAPGAAAPAARVPSRRTRRPVEDQILRGIQAGLAQGDYRVGEEVSEQVLAKRLGMARSRVRRGITVLQEQGMVGVDHGSGVSIRLPSQEDVVELYAARNALGTLAVRAAARRRDLDPARLADLLDPIRTAVRNGDSPLVQRLDAQFQIELAHASGMVRVPAMLESFHQQMMLYISVLGADYDYPVEEVLEWARTLATAVGDRDQAKAVQAWRQKMDAGATYMLGLIEAAVGQNGVHA